MTPPRAWLRGLPLGLLGAWLVAQAALGALRLDLPLLLAVGAAGVGWLAMRRLWITALLGALLLAPPAWHVAVQLPAAAALARGGLALRVEGIVRAREERELGGQPTARLLLGDAVLWADGERRALAEVEVELPARSAWGFPYRARLRIAGTLMPGTVGADTVGADTVGADTVGPGTGGARVTQGRLRLTFASAEHVREAPPISRWSGEALRLHLRDRAAYYLSRPALAVYLPIVLGIRERDTPESRQVAAAFRHVGVAHIFAISGLHVGLLYALFYGLQRWGLGWVQWGQGSVHAPAVRRVGVLAAVWLYIALIGLPIPAVRAAVMGTLLIWNEQRGTRSPPLYILALAALLVLAGDPSQLYDVSFQLSFLAVFFLLCALGLQPSFPPRHWSHPWVRRLRLPLAGAFTSLWLTAFITLGLWPVLAATFGRLSLMVFVGNLVMVPLLGWAILPLGLAGLAANLLCAGAPPGAWIERGVFAALDPTLRGWVWMVEQLDRLSEQWIVPLRLELPVGAVLGYYAALLTALAWALRMRRRAMRRGKGPPWP